MKTKVAASLVALSAACFGGSLAIQWADWPDLPEFAAVLDMADVILQSAAVAWAAIAALFMLRR